MGYIIDHIWKGTGHTVIAFGYEFGPQPFSGGLHESFNELCSMLSFAIVPNVAAGYVKLRPRPITPTEMM